MAYRNDFSCFDLPVTPMLSTKFRVNWSFSYKEAKKKMAAILDFRSEQFFYLLLIYKSPQSFLLRFESNGLSVQEKKRKNKFSKWPPWRPSWISDQNDFSYFWSTSHPDASNQV